MKFSSHYILFASLIIFCVGLFGCTPTKSQIGEIVSANYTISSDDSSEGVKIRDKRSKHKTKIKQSVNTQNMDPFHIYGDEVLNDAYDKWASHNYPKHPSSRSYVTNGSGSWYGPGLNGNLTASGEKFDMNAMTAAHARLPFGSIVVVTNQKNKLSVVVRITDRTPKFSPRIIDVSYGVAYLLEMIDDGVVPVHLEILRLGTSDPFFDNLNGITNEVTADSESDVNAGSSSTAVAGESVGTRE